MRTSTLILGRVSWERITNVEKARENHGGGCGDQQPEGPVNAAVLPQRVQGNVDTVDQCAGDVEPS